MALFHYGYHLLHSNLWNTLFLALLLRKRLFYLCITVHWFKTVNKDLFHNLHTILFLRTWIVDTFVFVESKMIISTFLVIFQIFEVISFPQSSERPTYPDHASCRIDW